MSAFKKRVQAWYEGRWVPYQNDPSSPVVFIGSGDFDRHWTARLARIGAEFWLEHWKWIIGIAVAIAAIVVKGRG